MGLIDLNHYSRRTLSDWLQIAQQCANVGNPLPCWLVELVVEEHDKLLHNRPAPVPPTGHLGKAATTVRRPPPKGAKCKLCGHVGRVAKRLECGAAVCEGCYNKVL